MWALPGNITGVLRYFFLLQNLLEILLLPRQTQFPTVYLDDYLIQAVEDIKYILTKPNSTPSLVPSLKLGDTTRNAILEIAEALHRASKLPPLPPPPKHISPSIHPPLPHAAAAPMIQATTVPPPRVETVANIIHHPANDYHLPLQPCANQFSFATIPIPLYRHVAARGLLALHLYETSMHQLNHIFDANGKKKSLDALLVDETKPVWSQALSNELGRLIKGNDAGV